MIHAHHPPGRRPQPLRTAAVSLAIGLALGIVSSIAPAQVGNEAVVEAREALRKKDRPRLAALRQSLVAARHPLAPWVDYWELGNRLNEVQQGEVDAFYERWAGSYVEDRLRNDWLLELGRRRDWANFTKDHARYRMQDDREVACYAQLTRHQAGEDVKAAALAAWYAQRDLDDGCHLLATTLADAKLIGAAEIWHELRLSVDANRPRAARAAAGLLGPGVVRHVGELLEQPAKFLKHRPPDPGPQHRELAVLALMRLAANDADAAAAELDGYWARKLDDAQAAYAWAAVGRQAAMRLSDRGWDFYQAAWKRQRETSAPPRWSDELLAWSVRAALRGAPMTRERWATIERSVGAMGAAEQNDPAWTYWRARAQQALARSGTAGEIDQEHARWLLEKVAAGLGFYAHLAAHDLGRPVAMPPAPEPLAATELAQAAQTPGLQRGLQMAAIGLRDEGRREWNFTLRGMGDRELLAAAHIACQAGDWQLCINTSERTRELVDLRQRYPTPWAAEITARAQERQLDPAFVFGLIRQETRFMPTLRSSAGASGLMQLMPATARWTARKIGLDLRHDVVTDVDTNLRLGTTYLKLVLDDFAGSQPLAAAAYNAGPNRPRRWREGPALEPAAWAENIPFNETRDYVKKVLSNAVVYSHLLEQRVAQPLRARLGPVIGPREAGAQAPDTNLP